MTRWAAGNGHRSRGQRHPLRLKRPGSPDHRNRERHRGASGRLTFVGGMISTQCAPLSVFSAPSAKSVFLLPPCSRVGTISQACYPKLAKVAALALWPGWPTWPSCHPDNNPRFPCSRTAVWGRVPGALSLWKHSDGSICRDARVSKQRLTLPNSVAYTVHSSVRFSLPP